LKGVRNIPARLIETLEGKFAVSTTKVVSVKESSESTKLLLELQDGSRIESVIMHFGDTKESTIEGKEALVSPQQKRDSELETKRAVTKKKHNTKLRSTLCVSSQIGCKMGCKFCATGTMGLRGHLMSGEILEQLYHANRHSRNPIRNVVFMGMGEPLDNYKSVITAVRAMVDTRRFGLAASRITISTVGVVPYMKKLRKDMPNVQLALSLHAPNQELRQKIVPTSSAFPLEKIMQALDDHLNDPNINFNHNRKVMIEYVVIDGVNDSKECAHQLVDLLKPRIGKSGRQLIVNLIPYNPTDVPEDYKPPKLERVREFHSILRSAGVLTTVRHEKGQDITGACGQLVVQDAKKRKQESKQLGDIEDLLGTEEPKRAKSTRNRGIRRRKGKVDMKMDISKDSTKGNKDISVAKGSRNWYIAGFVVYLVLLSAAFVAYSVS